MSDSPFDIKHRYGTCYATWYARRRAKELTGKYGFDGEDLAQELALHLLCQWPLYDPSKGKPTTFIQNVVDTKVCELIRDRCHPKRDYRCHRRLSAVGEEAELGLLDGVRGQPEVSDQERAEIRADCETVLNNLTPELRRIAELLKSKCPNEIARELDISEATVRRRVAELREHFVAAGYGAA